MANVLGKIRVEIKAKSKSSSDQKKAYPPKIFYTKFAWQTATIWNTEMTQGAKNRPS